MAKTFGVARCSTPACVKAWIKLITQCRFESLANGILGCVIRQLSGVANFLNPSLQWVQQDLHPFCDQWRLQQIAAELYVREAGALAGFQGRRWHDNSIAQLEAPSPQTHSGAIKCREAAKMIEQNRNPSVEIVGANELLQRDTGTLTVEFERLAAMKAKLSSRITANAELEIRQPELLCRKREEQSSGEYEEGMIENLGRKYLITEKLFENLRRKHRITEKLPRKTDWMDGRPTPAWMKARLDYIGQGGLQSRVHCDSSDWFPSSAQGNGSGEMRGVGTRSQAVVVLYNRLQRSITADSHIYVQVLQMCSTQRDLLATKQNGEAKCSDVVCNGRWTCATWTWA